MNVPSSDSFSSSPVSSFDLVDSQKSPVFSGHWEKCPDTDDLKEGMLPSCLSNSNLRGSSLNDTRFQTLLEATVLTGTSRNHPLPAWVGKKTMSTCPKTHKLLSSPSLFRHLKSFLSKMRQVGIPHPLRYQKAPGFSILALYLRLPGGLTVSSNNCLGQPRVC